MFYGPCMCCTVDCFQYLNADSTLRFLHAGCRSGQMSPGSLKLTLGIHMFTITRHKEVF